MGLFLIVGGVALIAAGVYILMSNKPEAPAPIIVETKVHERVIEKVAVSASDTISITDATNTPSDNTQQDRFEANKKKGDAFENYMIGQFDKKRFKLKEWRSDKRADDGKFVESSLNPDIEMEYSDGTHKYRFALECKYRSSFSKTGAIDWASDEQIKRYKKFEQDKGIKVYVAIGVGGTPDKPEQVYFTPLKNLSYSIAKVDYLNHFKRHSSNIYYNATTKSLE
jgi:hypothetical protein